MLGVRYLNLNCIINVIAVNITMDNNKNKGDTDFDSLLRKAEALGHDIKEMESIDAQEAYRRGMAKVRTQQRQQLRNHLMRYAAFLTLPLLLCSLVLSYLYFHNEEVMQYAEVRSAAGTVIRYELPDQSVVWLNAGTTLRYPVSFHKENRKVELDGEAFFEVKANSDRPFHVNTISGLSVYVYGTSFNVNAYQDENKIETVLEKGKVDVIVPTREATVKLLPGERLLYNKQSGEIIHEEVNVYEKTAWKEGKLVFRNTELKEIFKTLSRRFNVDIEYVNHSGKPYRYRATFRDETLSQILDYLAKSAELKWHIEESVQQADGTFSKTKIVVNLYK